jgi:Flavin-binding monooxygenase-like
MWKDIEYKKAEMASRYYVSQRHTIQVDYIPFMDELAERVGCRPNFRKFYSCTVFAMRSSLLVYIHKHYNTRVDVDRLRACQSSGYFALFIFRYRFKP